jgi:hypothetical protein
MQSQELKSRRKNLLLDPSAQASQVLKYTKSLQPSSTRKRLQQDCKVTLHTTKFTRLKTPISTVPTIILKTLMISGSPVCKAVCTKSGPKKLPPIPTATTSVSTLPVAPTYMEVQRERSAEKKVSVYFLLFF